MTHRPARAAALTDRPSRKLQWITLFGGAAAVALTAVMARAESHADVIVSHGISTFGDLKYPADFTHLDYVNPDAPKGGEFSTWSQGTFDSFNPYTRKGRAGSLSSSFFDSLLGGTADEIGASYCMICTTIEYPESRDWIVYNLNPDARFANGTPLTAEDVLFTYELFLNDGLPSFRAVLTQLVETVEVEDTYRLKVTFTDEAPFRDRVGSIGGLPVFSKAWFEENEYTLDESRLEMNMGSMPYVIEDFEVNQRIVYKRDDAYWAKDHPLRKGTFNYDKIRVEYFGDSVAALEGFKSGAYTFRIENSSKSWATSYDFPAIAEGTVKRQTLPDGTIGTGQSYAFNTRRPQFQDPRVREAIGLMFNFEWSNEALFFGVYERITSFWENTDLAATGVPSDGEIAILKPLVDQGLLDESILTDEAIMPPTSGERQLDRRNLRRASALLDEAGWEVGDDGIRRKDGQTLKLQIIEDSQAFDRIHNPFIQNLQALGIDATYERIDFAQYTNRTRANDFDLITDQFPMSYEPGKGLEQYFGSASADDSVFNSPGLKSPAVDAIIKLVADANERDEMVTAVRALDRVLRAEKFWIPQWFKDEHWVAHYDFYRYQEIPPFALGHIALWWIDQEAYDRLDAQGAL